MKYKKLIFLSVALITLTSCGFKVGPTSFTTTDASQTTAQSNTKPSTSNPREEVSVGSKLTIFSINDFHGKIEQDEKYNGLLASQGAILENPNFDPSTSLILSAGDMWQGSYLSGLNKGYDTTKLMNDFPFDAMTLGNHEFDWGFETILKNESVATFPFLCANLIDKTTNRLPEGISDHKVFSYANYKIGVVGAIGAELENTIKASMIEGYEFSSDLSLLQSAYKKCISEGANAVLLSVHDDEDSNYVNAIQSSSIPFLGIFGGHSHQFQLEKSDGIPYVQAGSDSRGYSYMTISTQANILTDINYSYIDGSMSQFATAALTKAVTDLINANPVAPIGYITGNWSKKQTAKLILMAMFDAVKVFRPDQSFSTENLVSIHNTGGVRGTFPSSSTVREISMEDIQVVSPFDNKVMFLPNRPIHLASLKNNYSYPNEVKENKIMNIVTIDYLVNDTYDKEMFTPTGAEPVKGVGKEDYIIYDCVADFIKRHSTAEDPLNASDFNY